MDKPQQDTGWEERYKTVMFDIFMKAKKPVKGYPLGQLEKRGIDFIREQKQLSEQQGYQRGYDKRTQEVLEMIGEDEPTHVKGIIVKQNMMLSRNDFRAEL